MENQVNYRQLLIDIRTKHNLSQEELADMLEVSRQTVARWESGKNNPAANQIARLCTIFNINPITLSPNLPAVEEPTHEELAPTQTEPIQAEETQAPSAAPRKALFSVLLLGALILLSVVGLIITISYAVKDSQFDAGVTTLIIALPQNTPMVVLAVMLGCLIVVLAAILILLIRGKKK